MPFVPESLVELRKRLGLSIEELAQELTKFRNDKNFRRTTAGISDTAVRSWEQKKYSPRWESINLLHSYARYKNHYDLRFYKPE